MMLKDLQPHSKAQLGQDLFVAQHTNFKKNGFYVEFGATNGVDISNTLMLEQKLGWTGILAEPARCWQVDLIKNRPNSIIDLSCVWSKTGESLVFNEVAPSAPGYSNASELSTIDAFSNCDNHSKVRNKGMKYEVQTISLNDLLIKHNAPSQIDYLSIDTEGSELEILANFDFNKFNISIITCEHNYTAARAEIFALLSNKGYNRVQTEKSRWDDWYVKA